jgi:glucosamine--fructose-6-phosphate aminotransferase (isomerizing)
VQLNLDVVQGRYLADLLDQPRALRDTWEGLRQAAVLESIAGSCNTDRFQRIVLTGMGSSYFGLHPLSMELAKRGWTPLMLETSELIHYYPHLLTPATLVVAVSQSGKSIETVRMLELNARRAKIIAVTNHAQNPLAQQADFVVLTAAGEEFSVSCKTYVSAQIALGVLGAALCRLDTDQCLREFEGAAHSVAQYLQNWTAHVQECADLLHDARDLFLVGRGCSLAAVGAGALIVKESARFHAEGMSSAAFRHGPFEMLHAGVFVGIFAGAEKTFALNEGLLHDVLRTPARAMFFAQDSKTSFCRLPKVPDAMRPIVEILPVQMVTLALAAFANHEPGRFEWLTKVTAIE